MNFREDFQNQLFSITNDTFEEQALRLFHYQAAHNPVYSRWLEALRITPSNINKVQQIPFLPITFFKEHKIITGQWQEEKVFESSGTTGQVPGRHYIHSLAFYHRVSAYVFERLYGALDQYIVLALLPSYLERNTSSLVYMADYFIRKTGHPASGFYLDNLKGLAEQLNKFKNTDKKVLLLGVTFALLDLAETYSLDLQDVIIMETGGMKGRRREMVREEVHQQLKDAFGVKAIHSEYGMTELMSQAYALKNGQFEMPPWMRVYLRDVNDPFYLDNNLRAGGLNIIDLANLHSCAFIQTQDMGRYTETGKLEVLGRIDNSDLRGCNLMVVR